MTRPRYLVDGAELGEEAVGAGQQQGAVGAEHQVGHVAGPAVGLQQQLVPQRQSQRGHGQQVPLPLEAQQQRRDGERLWRLL